MGHYHITSTAANESPLTMKPFSLFSVIVLNGEGIGITVCSRLKMVPCNLLDTKEDSGGHKYDSRGEGNKP